MNIINLKLLSRVTMPMHAEHDIVMANLCVRLSVCLSVTLWYCIEMNAHIVKLFPPSGMGMTSFSSAASVTKFQGELPEWGR